MPGRRSSRRTRRARQVFSCPPDLMNVADDSDSSVTQESTKDRVEIPKPPAPSRARKVLESSSPPKSQSLRNATLQPQVVKELSTALQTMQSELTCAICLSVCKDPVSLPCSHFYCNPCLSSLARRGTGKCPKCRRAFNHRERVSDDVIRKLALMYRQLHEITRTNVPDMELEMLSQDPGVVGRVAPLGFYGNAKQSYTGNNGEAEPIPVPDGIELFKPPERRPRRLSQLASLSSSSEDESEGDSTASSEETVPTARNDLDIPSSKPSSDVDEPIQLPDLDVDEPARKDDAPMSTAESAEEMSIADLANSGILAEDSLLLNEISQESPASQPIVVARSGRKVTIIDDSDEGDTTEEEETTPSPPRTRSRSGSSKQKPPQTRSTSAKQRSPTRARSRSSSVEESPERPRRSTRRSTSSARQVESKDGSIAVSRVLDLEKSPRKQATPPKTPAQSASKERKPQGSAATPPKSSGPSPPLSVTPDGKKSVSPILSGAVVTDPLDIRLCAAYGMPHFSSKRRHRLQSGKFAPFHALACHCCGEKGFKDDQILTCSKCSVQAHETCYGMPFSSDWVCEPCQYFAGKPNAAVSRESVRCMLCPRVDDQAFKRVTARQQTGGGNGSPAKADNVQGWVHVACALWHTGPIFMDPERRTPVAGLSRVDPERFSLKCSFCRGFGACVQCTYGRCYRSYHVTCGLRHGISFELKAENEEDDDAPVYYHSFCHKHQPVKDAVEVNNSTPTKKQAKVAKKMSSAPPLIGVGGTLMMPMSPRDASSSSDEAEAKQRMRTQARRRRKAAAPKRVKQERKLAVPTKSIVLLGTYLDDEMRDVLSRFIDVFDGSVVSYESECIDQATGERGIKSMKLQLSVKEVEEYDAVEVTHLITSADILNGRVVFGTRTMKYFLSILGHQYVLSWQWMRACIKAGRIIAETPFVVTEDPKARMACFRARQRLPIFRGLTFYIAMDSFKNTKCSMLTEEEIAVFKKRYEKTAKLHRLQKRRRRSYASGSDSEDIFGEEDCLFLSPAEMSTPHARRRRSPDFSNSHNLLEEIRQLILLGGGTICYQYPLTYTMLRKAITRQEILDRRAEEARAVITMSQQTTAAPSLMPWQDGSNVTTSTSRSADTPGCSRGQKWLSIFSRMQAQSFSKVTRTPVPLNSAKRAGSPRDKIGQLSSPLKGGLIVISSDFEEQKGGPLSISQIAQCHQSNTPILSYRWLLDCISAYSLVPMDAYYSTGKRYAHCDTCAIAQALLGESEEPDDKKGGSNRIFTPSHYDLLSGGEQAGRRLRTGKQLSSHDPLSVHQLTNLPAGVPRKSGSLRSRPAAVRVPRAASPSTTPSPEIKRTVSGRKRAPASLSSPVKKKAPKRRDNLSDHVHRSSLKLALRNRKESAAARSARLAANAFDFLGSSQNSASPSREAATPKLSETSEDLEMTLSSSPPTESSSEASSEDSEPLHEKVRRLRTPPGKENRRGDVRPLNTSTRLRATASPVESARKATGKKSKSQNKSNKQDSEQPAEQAPAPRRSRRRSQIETTRLLCYLQQHNVW